MLGARGVFTTHLPELAAMADTINAAVPGDSTAIGMVAGMRREERNGTPSGTYTVLPGPPQGHSFACDIAGQYGISLEHSSATLAERFGAPESAAPA